MIKNYWSSFIKNANKEKVKTPMGKIKVSLLSIATGIIFGLMIVWLIGGNPIKFAETLLTAGFDSSAATNQLLIFTSVFILAGLANAFAFKTGLFNIGVSGQMLAGGGVAMYLSITVFDSVDKMIAIPLLIIIAAATAGLVGLLVGFIKTKFNVHEVVSTILLNWIIFYLIKWLFILPGTPKEGSGDSLKTLHTFTSDQYTPVSEGGWPIAIIVSISVLVIIGVILKLTVFGKGLKMTGLSKSGSKYAAVNVKRSIILSMVISSVIAGILGFIFYFGKIGFMPAFQTTALPSIGFDGIALSLLAFNSPLGILPIALMYSMFKVGAVFMPSDALDSNISNETVSLIFSIMIYVAAVSTLFYRFKPVSFIIRVIKTKKDDRLILMKSEFAKKINHEKSIVANLKKDAKNNKEEFHLAKKQLRAMKKESVSVLREKHYELLDELINANYKISKNYVKSIINSKSEREIAFAKMALHTNISNANSNKNKLRELRKMKKDAKSKDVKERIKLEMEELKITIKSEKASVKTKISKAHNIAKNQIKQLKGKRKANLSKKISQYDKVFKKENLSEKLKGKQYSEQIEIKKQFTLKINAQVLKGAE